MADKLTNDRPKSALDLALGDKGYVSPPAPPVEKPVDKFIRKNSTQYSVKDGLEELARLSNMDPSMVEELMFQSRGAISNAVQQRHGYPVEYTSGHTAPTAYAQSHRREYLTMPVKDALHLAGAVGMFVDRYGYPELCKAIAICTNGKATRVQDLPEAMIHDFYAYVRSRV